MDVIIKILEVADRPERTTGMDVKGGRAVRGKRDRLSFAERRGLHKSCNAGTAGCISPPGRRPLPPKACGENRMHRNRIRLR